MPIPGRKSAIASRSPCRSSTATLAAALLAGATLWLAAVRPVLAQQPPQDRAPRFGHILLIVLENQDYADALADPYLGSLAQRGALLSNYHALAHPSYNNYLALVAGKLFDVQGDEQQDLPGPTVVDLLEARGLTWKGYAEGLPSACFLGRSAGKYARKHVPLLSFASIQRDPARCARVVPGDQIQADLAQLPHYAFYSPNQDDDGHDSGLPYASHWLQGFLEPLLANANAMRGTLVIVTFDECRTSVTNHVFTVLLGPMVRAGTRDGRWYTHFDLLRTVEDNFRLGTLGREDLSAVSFRDVWR